MSLSVSFSLFTPLHRLGNEECPGFPATFWDR